MYCQRVVTGDHAYHIGVNKAPPAWVGGVLGCALDWPLLINVKLVSLSTINVPIL